MDGKEKERFRVLLLDQFHDNLKDLNDALDKHIKSITYKKQFSKIMYEKHKQNDEFKQNKTEHDKKHYQEHKDTLLNQRKQKYHNDNEFKEKVKLQQKNRYSQLNNLTSLKPTSSGSISGSVVSSENI